MTDRFASPKRRLAHAQRRIDELEALLTEFEDSMNRWVEFDPKRGQDAHSIRFHKELPVVSEDIAAEALLALRSCLDQCGYAAATGAKKVKPKKTYFPISRGSPADLADVVKKNCIDLPPEIRDLFQQVQACKGGNEVLCALNDMRNKVHTAFEPHIVNLQYSRLEISSTPHDWEAPSDPSWDAGKNEIIYLWTEPGAQIAHQLSFSTYTAFADNQFLRGFSAIEALKAMAVEVEKVLSATESECKRLGFI